MTELTYIVTVRGVVPPDLARRLSAAHAEAIARRSTAAAPAR